MKIRAVMVARVKKASASVLENRRREYLKRHTICRRALHASEERQHLAERAKEKRSGMEHPIFEAYTLHPIGWKKRPESKSQANEWVTAIRGGVLPLGAYIITRAGSDLLTTGAKVGILFITE